MKLVFLSQERSAMRMLVTQMKLTKNSSRTLTTDLQNINMRQPGCFGTLTWPDSAG